jgi:threonine/homoserine/homoserine lactone efflux protein
MSASLALFGILGALLVGAVSPGPSFVLVSRIAATASRRDGLWAAMGMGLGGAMFATLALLGLATVLLRIEWLYLVLRSLAVTRRRAARSALLANEQSRRVRGFRCRGPNERHS